MWKGCNYFMSYKIVVDSCCELPEEYKHDKRFESVPLRLEVGSYHIWDDESFNQAEFLAQVAACPECPKSACPSPERFRDACKGDAEHIYMVTLSSKLSGSFNSARLGADLYQDMAESDTEGQYPMKQIHVFDSQTAAGGETQIAMKILEFEEAGCSFEEVIEKVDEFIAGETTLFVLDNLETLRKNGRLSKLKAMVATTLNIKPVLAGDMGEIVQRGQGIGSKKALNKMLDLICENGKNLEKRQFIITQCNCPERAEYVRRKLVERIPGIRPVMIMESAGVSTMYEADGGIIVTF